MCDCHLYCLWLVASVQATNQIVSEPYPFLSFGSKPSGAYSLADGQSKKGKGNGLRMAFCYEKSPGRSTSYVQGLPAHERLG